MRRWRCLEGRFNLKIMKNSIKENSKLLLFITISLIILMITSSNFLLIWEYINKFFMCKTMEMNSFPCYGIYSIFLMVSSLFVFNISSIILTLKYYKIVKNLYIKFILFLILLALLLLTLWTTWVTLSVFNIIKL